MGAACCATEQSGTQNERLEEVGMAKKEVAKPEIGTLAVKKDEAPSRSKLYAKNPKI